MDVPLRVISSPSAAARVSAATAAVSRAAGSQRVLIVGATRAAADELALAVARERGALFGVSRVGLFEQAARLALPELAHDRRSPTGMLGAEAVVTRAAFEARQRAALGYFAPVADLPGFPRAAARTLAEVEHAGIGIEPLAALDGAGRDLGVLLGLAEEEAARAGTATRSDVLAVAARVLTDAPARLQADLVVLLDVSVTNVAEERYLAALVNAATEVFATVPAGDARTAEALARITGGAPPVPAEADGGSDLERLQRFLFSLDTPPSGGAADDSVHVYSAPGEGREAVEVARRVLEEADRGVPFDEMAVLLRAPATYFGLLEHAFSRAGVPVWFERGARRPDPAGRAFLALLACADEGLSARRFAEYLSLAQVPSTPVAAEQGWTPAGDEAAAAFLRPEDRPADPAPEDEAPAATERDGSRVVAGTLRAPWRWEELLVESYVIEGLDRWQRRLPGLAHEYDRRIRELRDEEDGSPRIAALERDRAELGHLQAFALPIVEALDGWRSERRWADWLAAFRALVPRVLRRPARVLRVLGELEPLGLVGPVTLREVRDVLAPRLLTLTAEPPRRRHGRVFIGTPDQARGRRFRVVFVPGLAERIFPQRLREDPLLLDERRRRLDAGLTTADDRAEAERLQLRLAVGAASERAYLSYPRLELRESRPRVPSFYVLDALRATTGAIPRYAELSARAAAAGAASLAWPAPVDPARAIDDFEHDLAVLLPLLQSRDRKAVQGRARYLLELNDALRRSVIERWARWQNRWHQADGLIRVTDDTLPALGRQRLAARPYSLTALQRYAACPYQFQLSALYRLAPLETPAPLQRLDPLTRGSLFHEIQAEFFRTLARNGQLPVTDARRANARQQLEWAIQRVTTEAEDKLAPAIEKVWADEVAGIRRDLLLWLDRLPEDAATWVPERFELAFGLAEADGRDPASTRDPVRVGPGYLLRGSIDLVERRADGKALRVTDHKTGKNRTTLATVVGGGKVLQPVLYGMALEALTGETVAEGRLSYCTTAGGFTVHAIPLDAPIRGRALEVLEIIDRAVERGTLAAYPASGTCQWCDFRPVCGPDEERRTARKPEAMFEDLLTLRKYP
ncbi:MAG: PD-(D/E)XK nuclease family protein [Vicinamibacterales bacterium]